MLKNIIILILAVESAVATWMLYKNIKAMESLRTFVSGLNLKLDREFKELSGELKNDLKKQIYNLSMLGIVVKR